MSSSAHSVFASPSRLPPNSPLFPYTTLFRSGGGVSFVFLLPGVGETLRLNGSVVERASGVVVIAVEEAFVHCAQCVLRSGLDRKSTRLNSSHPSISYAVFCLKKKKMMLCVWS